ncbi:MAG: glycosyltransferase family 2 protein [Candidatus Omnitrophica bacterium]|nr:glycosyltransferase family 2 protein [Candidatus Omnitrophota bacterium]
MKLSIIIPAYNEQETIEEALRKILAVDLSGLRVKKEVIVVDDGSTDRTTELVKNFTEVKLLRHNINLGKGKAVLTGFRYSTGDIILIQDADLEYSPEDYPNLLFPIITQKASVVYGTRFHRRSQRKNMRLLYFIANKFGTILTNLLYNANISDEATCYKVFTKDVFKNLNLKCDRFSFDPEVTAKLLKKGIKIYEVPISYVARSRYQGKKFTFLDGLGVFWTLIRLRFGSQDEIFNKKT